MPLTRGLTHVYVLYQQSHPKNNSLQKCMIFLFNLLILSILYFGKLVTLLSEQHPVQASVPRIATYRQYKMRTQKSSNNQPRSILQPTTKTVNQEVDEYESDT